MSDTQQVARELAQGFLNNFATTNPAIAQPDDSRSSYPANHDEQESIRTRFLDMSISHGFQDGDVLAVIMLLNLPYITTGDRSKRISWNIGGTVETPTNYQSYPHRDVFLQCMKQRFCHLSVLEALMERYIPEPVADSARVSGGPVTSGYQNADAKSPAHRTAPEGPTTETLKALNASRGTSAFAQADRSKQSKASPAGFAPRAITSAEGCIIRK